MKRIIIIALIGIIISTVNISNAQTEHKYLTLEDIFTSRKFYPEYVYGINSLNDGEHYCVLENDSINVYTYKQGTKTKTIVTSSQLIPEGDTVAIPMRRFALSKDESKIFFAAETERIYRHSTKSNYYIWDIKNEKLSVLSKGGKQRLATFSPDASKVAFIRENNLFIKDLINDNEIQITKDGLYNNIIYGTTDWVYEEEFGFTKAFFWSPDGSKIAFYRFDESNVKEYFLTMYSDLYPEEYKYKYPKAGEDNSVVNIYIYDVNLKTTKQMDTGKEKDQYIPRIKWTKNPDILSILRMNRLQNKLEILLADANTGSSKVIYTEKNKYYIDITDDLTFLNDKKHFIITSEQDGFNHIYLYNIEGKLVRQLTHGNWDVTQLTGINEKNQLVYYISAEVSPLNRELYSIKLNGKDKIRISAKEGNNSVRFSKIYKYYINTYSNANTPPYITVNNAKGKELRILKDNIKLIDTLKEYNYNRKEFFTFKTSENIELNCWMIKPYDFDSTKKYPVLLYIYGGPGSQTVRNSWSGGSLWYQMLAQKGIIV
ncbi:MAG: DPP IV N-terminal domain-containing protein, partial [Bacteroidales bacterium]|nr:DPP IV N-terminal domain-containing protein [Bacteroidales bacterium]